MDISNGSLRLIASGFRQHPAARDAIALSNRNALLRK
jgi:hypothetical protein